MTERERPRGESKPQASRRLFDRWAPSFESGRMSAWFQHYQRRVLDRALEIGPGDVLDVGCGTGWLVREAASRFPDRRVAGVDLSPGMIAEARERATRADLVRAEFLQADAGRLPFASESFDLVICTASFHHYPDPVRVLRGWREVLRPGGRFLLLESCTSYPPIWVYDKALRLLEKGHVRYYRTVDLIRFAEEAGFRNVRPLWRERGMFVRGKLFSSLVLVEGTVPP